MFTGAAWSLAQPDVIFFSDESGTLQMWEMNGRKSEPFQTQDISGRPINGETRTSSQNDLNHGREHSHNSSPYTAICPYVRANESGEKVHYMSVADETGTLHLMELPNHLRKTSAETVLHW